MMSISSSSEFTSTLHSFKVMSSLVSVKHSLRQEGQLWSAMSTSLLSNIVISSRISLCAGPQDTVRPHHTASLVQHQSFYTVNQLLFEQIQQFFLSACCFFDINMSTITMNQIESMITRRLWVYYRGQRHYILSLTVCRFESTPQRQAVAARSFSCSRRKKDVSIICGLYPIFVTYW